MELTSENRSFDGRQQVWTHTSKALGCSMNVGVYLPPRAAYEDCPVLYWLSGLTCTEQNFITKAGAQAHAADHGIIIVAPDTSPRGDHVADDEAYDLGKGAGFYVNATQPPWSKNFRMYDYIVEELHELIGERFPTNGKYAITGHSMGGHGALVVGLRNASRFTSISAFSPIVAPSDVPWGEKAFTAYLGTERGDWAQYDASKLVATCDTTIPIRIEQGDADQFFEEQLQTARFQRACDEAGREVDIRMREGYDHSYYFIATFIGEHVAFHAKHLL